MWSRLRLRTVVSSLVCVVGALIMVAIRTTERSTKRAKY